jgi:fengycin family lipopeptide synthetase D
MNNIIDYPKHKTLHHLFQEQAARTPANPAVKFKDQSLSYRELNENANRLARLLRKKGIGPDILVAIMVERSFAMMTGLMAILKSGGAYLPVSPDYPPNRIKLLLRDSGTRVVLTQGKFAEKFNTLLGADFDIIDLEAADNYSEPPDNLPPLSGPGNLAYAIYTSGSTGTPKGVTIEHHSVINRLYWMQRQYPLGESDTILQKTPFFFDVSVWELFWWSLVGASVCFLLPNFERFPQAIIETVAVQGITVMHFVPSMMAAFLGYLENAGDFPRLASLKRIFVSGEALKPSHLELFNRTLYDRNKTRLANLYGPTEATVDVSYFDCPHSPGLRTIPIGKAIDNIRLYIMSEDLREQPPGVEGELCIGGAGLARGYLNRPVLTAEKFCLRRPGGRFLKKLPPWTPRKNFFSMDGKRGVDLSRQGSDLSRQGISTEDDDSPGGQSLLTLNHQHPTLYRTGDRARLLEDGNIEFLGRMDFQVKIRGLRIELGEIESALSRHPAVQDCAVLVKETSETIVNLVAYMTSTQEVTPGELKKFLKGLLPDYMIPSEFVVLGNLPSTPTGKVDRKKLAALT